MKITTTLLITILISLTTSCITDPSGPATDGKTDSSLPEYTFYRWCDAMLHEDFDTIYNLLSADTKKLLRETNGLNIKSGQDYKLFLGDSLPRLKELLKGATIKINFIFEDKALGTAKWSDGTKMTIGHLE